MLVVNEVCRAKENETRLDGQHQQPWTSKLSRPSTLNMIIIIKIHIQTMENLGKNRGEKEFVLKTGMDSDSVINRVNKAFDEIPEAIGLNNHQGSKATSDSLLMTYVGSVLKKRNKFFIDSRTTSETVAEETMSRLNVLTNRRNIFLDNELDKTKITKQLMSLVNIAERDGSAIGIGHVKVETLNVLKEQIPLIKEKGFKFEFVSKMLDK